MSFKHVLCSGVQIISLISLISLKNIIPEVLVVVFLAWSLPFCATPLKRFSRLWQIFYRANQRTQGEVVNDDADFLCHFRNVACL